jgi:hypothetical protein
MKITVLLSVTLFLLAATVRGQAPGQASDFITVKKKNDRTLMTWFPGLRVYFETREKLVVEGEIVAIRHDSIYVKQWDVRSIPTTLGVTMLDTVGVYVNGFHYTEIYKVADLRRHGFAEVTLPKLLIIGGAGYIFLNLVNGNYFNQSLTENNNLQHLSIAAAAVAAGVLIQYLSHHGNHNGGKYRVVYVHMEEPGKSRR